MPRSRKQISDVAIAPEVSVPQVLITRDQYFQDIKIRWQIHQYEVTKLREDVSKFTQTVVPYMMQAVEYATEKYQQLTAKRVTV